MNSQTSTSHLEGRGWEWEGAGSTRPCVRLPQVEAAFVPPLWEAGRLTHRGRTLWCPAVCVPTGVPHVERGVGRSGPSAHGTFSISSPIHPSFLPSSQLPPHSFWGAEHSLRLEGEQGTRTAHTEEWASDRSRLSFQGCFFSRRSSQGMPSRNHGHWRDLILSFIL